MADSPIVSDLAGPRPTFRSRGPWPAAQPKAFSRLATWDLLAPDWDYVLVTAGDAPQARFFQQQLSLRQQMGLLPDTSHVLAIGDPSGSRLGSGGSTLWCWMQVLERELPAADRSDPQAWHAVLAQRRILILHAGGPSQRLPAYRTCGKCFIPLPGARSLFDTLLDQQLAAYLALSPPRPGMGHTLIASGDVLVDLEPHRV